MVAQAADAGSDAAATQGAMGRPQAQGAMGEGWDGAVDGSCGPGGVG